MRVVLKVFEKEVERETSQHPRASDNLKVVYPKSTEFLEELPEESQQRLKDLGWDLPNTVHLGMPYFGAYPPAYEPSYSLLGLVRLLDRGVYFRSVVWNEDYLEEAHDISVEESIHHEKLHITEDVEPRFRKSKEFTKEHKLERGREIKKKSVSSVLDKYGKRAEDMLYSDGINRYKEQAEGGTILGEVLTFWLRRYFEENYIKYKDQAIELTPRMKEDEIRKSIENDQTEIGNIYRRKFGFSIDI